MFKQSNTADNSYIMTEIKDALQMQAREAQRANILKAIRTRIAILERQHECHYISGDEYYNSLSELNEEMFKLMKQ